MAKDDPLAELLDELDVHGDLERSEQTLSIRHEKRRYGKPVTIVEGFDLPEQELKPIASDLKQAIGTGGTVDNRRIELQGKHDDRVRALLTDHGFSVQ